jgi:hypothetical protein
MMKRQRNTCVGHAGTVHYIFLVCSGHFYDLVLQSAVPRFIYVRCIELICPVESYIPSAASPQLTFTILKSFKLSDFNK